MPPAKKKKTTSSTDREYHSHRIMRIEAVYDLLLAGLSRAEILRFVAEQHPEWNIRTRQIESLIACAKAKLKEASETHREEELGKALDRLDKLYQRSYAINDYKTCAAIVKQRADLLGIAAPAKVEHSGEQNVHIVVTYEDEDAK